MTTQTATPQARMLEITEGCTANGVDVLDLIREMYNCVEAEMDDAGNVWIAGSQTGRWLSNDELGETADWIEAQ